MNISLLSAGGSTLGSSGHSGAIHHPAGIRRASEDQRYRAFLSSHFDAQGYVTNIIKEGTTEEYLTQIGACIKEVDDEIKTYISGHKHDLMSGMQDVATLATRYQELESTAHKLRSSIDKMQRETSDSYELVKSRTMELERIHETSIILKQLRQFNHAKAQLDHYTKEAKDLSGVKGDLRQYSTMAKIIQELETLLRSPTLSSLAIVKSQTETIKRMGSQLRSLSQERLLNALNEQNQATVAECLQVFYNLKSLPEIILLAIDMTVKSTSEIATSAIDLNLLLHETSTSQTTAAPQSSSGSSSVLKRAIEQSISVTSTSSSSPPQETLLSNATQLRVAMREMCHQWATATQEQATKIHVLQRVIAHKEDPSTHEKFLDVLRSIQSSSPHSSLLSAGRLVDVFWVRLSSTLQDVIAEKVRFSTLAATRVYPTIRRASFELYNTLRTMTSREPMIHHSSSLSGLPHQIGNMDPVRLLSLTTPLPNSCTSDSQPDPNADEYDTDPLDREFSQKFPGSSLSIPGRGGWKRAQQQRQQQSAVGLFGSLLTTSTPYYVNGPASLSAALSVEYQKEKRNATANESSFLESKGEQEQEQREGQGEEEIVENDVTTSLLSALAPMRDRYLTVSLNKMNEPVLQMFSESEGYSAAIPSRRDLQTLVKVIQDELASVVIESDRGLVKIIGREAAKTIQLFLTKVENMAMNGMESLRISFQNNQFQRTHPQEHNKQLVTLLHQLQEILDRMTAQIVKATKDSPGTALASSLQSKGGAGGGGVEQVAKRMEAMLRAELTHFFQTCQQLISDLTAQLLSPLTHSIEGYFRDLLLGLLREGGGMTSASAVASLAANKSTAPPSGCSRSVDAVVAQFPLALETYLLSLPRTPSVVSAAQSLSARLLLTFTSIACLRRPVNEQTRLLTATEISALDMMTTSLPLLLTPAIASVAPSSALSSLSFPSLEDALNELRSYRRLLFDADISCLPPSLSAADVPPGSGAGGGFGELGSHLVPAPPGVLFTRSYVSMIRSSTLLGYLLSAGPRQIPSPLEHYLSAFQSNNGSSSLPPSYVTLLLSFDDLPAQRLSSAASSLSFRNRLAQSVAEKKSIDVILSCLDVFVQRVSVTEDSSQKTLFKLWYDSLSQLANSAQSL